MKLIENRPIYVEENYDKFMYKPSNRKIKQKHLEQIKDAIKEYGYNKFKEIDVSDAKDGKYYIEDGQYRYTACKELGFPIYFKIVGKKSVYELSEENRLQDKWGRQDYVNAYSYNDDGSTNYNYKRFDNLLNNYGDRLKASCIYSVVVGCDGGQSLKYDSIKKGYMRLSEESYNNAIDVLDRLVPLSNELKRINLDNRAYLDVLIKLLKGNFIDENRMLKGIKNNQFILTKVATKKQALEKLNEVYNYHINSKNVKELRALIKV